MEIQEKNRFTATELKTLIPLEGKAIFELFYENNKWVNGYFKNFKPQTNSVQTTKKPYLIAFRIYIEQQNWKRN